MSVKGSLACPLLGALSNPFLFLRGSSLLSLRLRIAEGTPAAGNEYKAVSLLCARDRNFHQGYAAST